MERLIPKSTWWIELNEMVTRFLKATDLALLCDHRADLFQRVVDYVGWFKDAGDLSSNTLRMKNGEWETLVTEIFTVQQRLRQRQNDLASKLLDELEAPSITKMICLPSLSPSGFIVPKPLTKEK